MFAALHYSQLPSHLFPLTHEEEEGGEARKQPAWQGCPSFPRNTKPVQRLLDAEGSPARGQGGRFERSPSGLASQAVWEVAQ